MLLGDCITPSFGEISTFGASVVDGGALLYRVSWPKGATFSFISALYVTYLKRNFVNPTVIFDGYGTSSTKDHEHLRRYSVPLSSFVTIRDSHTVPYNQKQYFSLSKNKAELIKYLTKKFNENGIQCKICPGDADVDIVRSALCQAEISPFPVVVVADDTDIAVLLLYHWKQHMSDVYLLQESKNQWRKISKSQSEIHILNKIFFFTCFLGL